MLGSIQATPPFTIRHRSTHLVPGIRRQEALAPTLRTEIPPIHRVLGGTEQMPQVHRNVVETAALAGWTRLITSQHKFNPDQEPEDKKQEEKDW